MTIRGEPNAGKSQLFNCLAGRHAAIVADVAGTTRDVVAIETELGGHTVTLMDTAGIEQVSSSVRASPISVDNHRLTVNGPATPPIFACGVSTPAGPTSRRRKPSLKRLPKTIVEARWTSGSEPKLINPRSTRQQVGWRPAPSPKWASTLFARQSSS